MEHGLVDLFNIKVLAAVCQAGSYRVAAQTLGINPAAVSKAVRELERAWNLKLIHSNGSTITISEKAQQVAAISAELLLANDVFIRKLAVLRDEVSPGIMKVGSGGSNTKVLAMRLIEFLAPRNPVLEFELLTSNSSEVTQGIIDGVIDCGIIAGEVSDLLDKELLFYDTISLYVHNTNPLLASDTRIEDVEFPFCFREKGSSTRKFVEGLLYDRNIHLRHITQTGKNDELTESLSIKQHALQFLSDYFHDHSKWKADYVKLHETDIKIEIPVYFVTKRDLFRESLRTQIRAFAAGKDF